MPLTGKMGIKKNILIFASSIQTFFSVKIYIVKEIFFKSSLISDSRD